MRRIAKLENIYEPIIISTVYIIVSFFYHFSSLLNPLGLLIFSTLSLFINCFWVIFFTYYLKKFSFSIGWLGAYLIWLISIIFFIWALYQKTLFDISFYIDMLVLSLTGLFFFKDSYKKIYIAFAFAMVATYIFYYSLQTQWFFFLLIIWLIITGLRLDSLLEKGLSDKKHITILYIAGLMYSIATLLISHWIYKLIINNLQTT